MNNSYGMVIARAVDILFCSFIWRDYDITISSMCGLELRKPNPRWWAVLLGGALNKIQTGHCESAIIADRARCVAALVILGDA
jgi:hypothetical protein